MKTVTEVSRVTGVSIRTLHHYDAIGLLRPTRVSEAGYRMYDDAALERLYKILVFRELGFSLRQIGELLDTSENCRSQVLRQQIDRMQSEIARLKKRISLAEGIRTIGVNEMDFTEFDQKKLDDYGAQARALYGKTDAYREYAQKAKNRSKQQENALGRQVMAFFAELGTLRHEAPDSEAVQDWVSRLQAYFTEHFYTCTPQILACLAQSYADGGSMNENIDAAGGPGTGAFAKQAIEAYLNK